MRESFIKNSEQHIILLDSSSTKKSKFRDGREFTTMEIDRNKYILIRYLFLPLHIEISLTHE